MKQAFDPRCGLIIVRAELHGVNGAGVLRLALDTGATGTLVSLTLLATLGYDPARAKERVRITTGSGVTLAPLLEVSRLAALGKTCRRFPVLGHTLPPGAGVDGLLGLDFFRGHRLAIDFQDGVIDLSA